MTNDSDGIIDSYVLYGPDGYALLDGDIPIRVLVASVSAEVRSGESYVGLYDDDQIIRAMVLLTAQGCYRRDQGYWIPLDPDNSDEDADLGKWDAYDTDPTVIPLWDSAQRSDGTLVLSDLFAA